MKRKKLQELLDAVLDITDGGEGLGGYPYVSIRVSNLGESTEVRISDNGFVRFRNFDGDYTLHGDSDKQEYKKCMEHLKRLKRRIDNGG